MDRRYPARWFGHLQNRLVPGSATIPGGNTVFYTSSGTATSLVSWPNPGTLRNGGGNLFASVGFEVSGTAITYGIDGSNLTHAEVRDCAFTMFNNPSAWAIYTAHDDTKGNDHSWWTITGNASKYGGLFKSAGTAQGNGHYIHGNEAYGGPGSGATPRSTNPAIWLEGGSRINVAHNNWETFLDSTYGAVYLNGVYLSSFVGDGGENPAPGGSAPAGPFYYYVLDGNGTHSNFIQISGPSTPDTTEVLVWIKAVSPGPQFNIVVAPALNESVWGASVTNRIKDDTTAKYNWIMGGGKSTGQYWWTPHLKVGEATPESGVYGYVGDLFVNHAGAAGSQLFVKESGNNTNTGWVAQQAGVTSFSVGALLEGSPPANGFRMVWVAPFACTVTAIRSHFDAGTNIVVNARKNQASNFLSADHTNSTANAWDSTAANQNQAIAAGDDIEINLVSTSGAVTKANIQVDLTRP
jgi:hypothetical protein